MPPLTIQSAIRRVYSDLARHYHEQCALPGTYRVYCSVSTPMTYTERKLQASLQKLQMLQDFEPYLSPCDVSQLLHEDYYDTLSTEAFGDLLCMWSAIR